SSLASDSLLIMNYNGAAGLELGGGNTTLDPAVLKGARTPAQPTLTYPSSEKDSEPNPSYHSRTPTGLQGGDYRNPWCQLLGGHRPHRRHLARREAAVILHQS